MAIKQGSLYGNGRAVLNEALQNREAFRTGGALRGGPLPDEKDVMTREELGWLDDEEANLFMIDYMAGIEYVVWSYDTPIAWVRRRSYKGERVHHVKQRFGTTTSKHQNVVRRYLK